MTLIAGVDEAGRGPLAGPVVAAAVIIPADFPKSGLKDSKKLTKKEREFFFALIKEKALAFEVALVDAEEIDRINIFQATLKAMAESVRGLRETPEKVLVDGNRTIPGIKLPQEAIVKGDSLHPAIMCAAIMAKVTRDRLMNDLHKKYPQYGFRAHKGYGTKLHLTNLKLHGPSPAHRKSFAPVRELLGLPGE